jgi:hypothetical protein
MRNALDVRTLDDVAHSDYGWEQVFRVLTVPDLPVLLFGDGKTYTGWNAGGYLAGVSCHGQPLFQNRLADALQAIGDRGDRFDLHNPQLDVMFFMLRAADRGLLSTETDSPAYEPSIDPAATSFEPHTAYGC